MHNKNVLKKFITTSAGRIAYFETVGQDTPIVLLHGNSCSKEFMLQQLEGLGLQYNMIAIDLPGHGESDNALIPAKHYTITGYANLVIEVVKKLNLNSILVVGWSLGGEIAIEMMGLCPRLLKGIVISGTPPIVRSYQGIREGYITSELSFLISKQKQYTDEDVIAYWSHESLDLEKYPILFQACKRTHGLARKIMFDAIINGGGVNEKETVKNCPIPLGIIMGLNDQAINHDYIQSLTYSNCVMMESIEGSHDCLWGNAKDFNNLIKEFIRRIQFT